MPAHLRPIIATRVSPGCCRVLVESTVVALEAMLNFSVPLYIQIVQGQSPLATAIAMMPFNLTVFFAALLVVRLYNKLAPNQIGRYGFIVCTVALVWLAQGAGRRRRLTERYRSEPRGCCRYRGRWSVACRSSQRDRAHQCGGESGVIARAAIAG
jgi:hypothetical protein